jgi:hypothetical protein
LIDFFCRGRNSLLARSHVRRFALLSLRERKKREREREVDDTRPEARGFERDGEGRLYLGSASGPPLPVCTF